MYDGLVVGIAAVVAGDRQSIWCFLVMTTTNWSSYESTFVGLRHIVLAVAVFAAAADCCKMLLPALVCGVDVAATAQDSSSRRSTLQCFQDFLFTIVSRWI